MFPESADHYQARQPNSWSGWRTVWTLVLFDLPMKTKKDRKAYSDFRKKLLECGFTKLQFSVYTRFAANDERAAVFESRIRQILPNHGEVRIIQITGKQFEKMQVFVGISLQEAENEPCQLEFF